MTNLTQLIVTVTQTPQTIVFTAPTTTTVAYGVAPITLAATGGASTSPIVFTVDATSTAGAGSITGNTLTVTGVGTIIVDANQAGSMDYSAAAQQQLTITVASGTVANFGLTISIPAITISSTQGYASETITVTPTGGFNAPITFACTQVPAGVSCSFSPSTVTPSGGPVSTVLTVSSNAAVSSLNHNNSNPLLPTGATLAAALCFFGFRRRRNLKLVLLLAVSFVGLGLCTGCSHTFYGSSTSPNSDLPTVGIVVVTATSGTLVQTAQFQVTLTSPNQQ